MIVERVKAGLSQARSQGKRRQPVSAEVVERIRDESATGKDILKTTKDLASASGEYIG
jgi:DNA invertase Pin-like site-specific DNA recombinase